MTTDYEINVMTRGGLIGDKLTTLSLDAIGLPQRKHAEIPKQVFDIGSQLRVAEKQDILDIFETFETFTDFKISRRTDKHGFTISNTVDNIEKSLLSFFELGSTSVQLTRDQRGKFDNFIGTYLGKPRTYKNTAHLGNILLILVLIKQIRRYLAKSASPDELSDEFLGIIKKIDGFGSLERTEMTRESELLSSELPDAIRRHKKMLSGQPLEYAYLLTRFHQI